MNFASDNVSPFCPEVLEALSAEAKSNAPAYGGDDIIYGGGQLIATVDGNDQLYGGAGNDQLFGNAGNDYILGGDHYLDATDGADSLYGRVRWHRATQNGRSRRLHSSSARN